MKQIHTFIFFGIVGSGKGTQVELLNKYLLENNLSNDIIFVSTGNQYRTLIKGDSYTGKLIKNKNDKGELQPNFLTIGLFTNILVSSMKENSTIIADGFPRTIEQSVSFEHAMNFYKRDNIHIVYIELSKEEAVKRMKLRGRSDDNEEGMANRFEEYTNKVIPSLNYFKNKEKYTIHNVDGNQSIEQVHLDIIKSLNL